MIEKKSNLSLIFLGYSLLAFIALLFSPLVSWIMTIVPLILFSEYLRKIQRILFSSLFILSSALTASSRHIFFSKSDDFIRYYDNFLIILQGDYSAIFEYGAGLEVGLPLIHYFIASVFGNVTPHIIIFFYAFISLMLFYVWIEKYGINFISNNKKSFVVALSLLMFSALMATHLVRQMYSSIFLLYAIIITGGSRFIFLLIAGMFHSTAIPIYILIKFIQKYKIKAIITILIGSLFLYSIFGNFLEVLTQSPYISNTLSNKAYYYLIVFEDVFFDEYVAVKILPLLVIYLLLINKTNKELTKWTYIVISFSIISLSMITITSFSFRISLIITAVLYGYLIAIRLAESRYWRLSQLILFFFVMRKWLNLIDFKEIIKSNVELWYSFDRIGNYPFYYWL